MRFAKIADEDGLRWDSASCLVLLSSALGVTTQPWKKPPETQSDTLPRAGDARDTVPFFENKTNAEAYFLAAKKRLGLLGDSLLDIQCLFLAFIYEKTYFRHLQAWSYLQQAAARLQVRLLKTGTRPWATCASSGPNDLHIEQRVFWSCFRAEREFLLEIDLPPSGLGDLSYPDPLPEPPLTFATLAADAETKGLSPTNYDSQFEERGWCYYLAEISLRRTIDDTLQHLAEGGEEAWLSNPSQLVRQYHELEKQRSIWRFHLPAIVQFDDEQVPDNEFAFGLRSRFLEWNELLLRPILYHVLHLPSDQIALPECVELAEKAVHGCVQKIHEYQHTLRHGGSWFITRRIFGYACLVLAAARQPERRIKLPLRWGSAIRVAIQTLRFWSQDAADVRHMTSTLDMMFSRTCL
ncbi:Fungal-trans domain-containing protein [Fusarium keratoplasticum]|uniref:Fungal-trans domain-containing protein n=1 Tax=Fusarium keratoplasticum TaxID=1328300 RepID=A0ACC0R8U3_9HYPO|nr:Fungal-trans domain-containing protein [Fusarium keratoplasticum]KAI8675992.1 Fungal-trans domain-containing protein [Fusarium keratoplasticum]